MDRRKELILAYKQTPTPMGVYQLTNRNNGKALIGSSMNLPGKFNSLRFQLKNSSHTNVTLQGDWSEQGSDAFTFEILDTITPEKVAKEDWRKTLLALEEKWLNEVQPFGAKGYNNKK